MKTFRRLTIFISGVLLCFVLSSCGGKFLTEEEVARWIAAYSPDVVDPDSKIRVEMTDYMIAKIDTAKNLTRYFEFNPSVRGSVELSRDRRCIDFIPDESLQQGQRYECTVKVGEFAGIDSLGDFRFDFFVRRQQMRFEDVAATVDSDDRSMMTVTGRLCCSVAPNDSILQNICPVICDYPGATVTVDKSGDGKEIRFVISGIARKDNAFRLTVSTNPIQGFSAAQETLEIPAVSEFKLIHSKLMDVAEPYLNLEFSSPLSSRQELDGLITVDRIEDIKIEREGTNVKVYFPRTGIRDIVMRVSSLVKNIDDRCLGVETERHFMRRVIPPAVEIPLEGNILSDNENLCLPFRAVNLAAVDVEVVKIFPQNVMSFLQENDLDDNYRLRRFGRLIFHKTVRLDKDKSVNLHQWQNFSINLKNLFQRERGAIYNIRLSFRRAYSLYDRHAPDNFKKLDGITSADKATWDKAETYIYRDAPDYNWNDYDWNEVNDPSKPSYYMQSSMMPECNLVASNLGLIVKHGEKGVYNVAVADIVNACQIGGVEVAAYNYQLQKIAVATTDNKGFAALNPAGRPFMITATDGKSTTYLKVTPGRELSTSNFDVSGKSVDDGVKGFVYGDRGVWRPGDVLHLSLILNSDDQRLTDNHPVVMELYNPLEQLYVCRTLAKGTDGFYVFHVPVDENAPTGVWNARFKIGNTTFNHKVRIETVKPNRLKISIVAPKIIKSNEPVEFGINARWLSGPVAKDLAASMEMMLYNDHNPFDSFKNYTFSNPIVTYKTSNHRLFNDRLDSLGLIRKQCIIGADMNAPGMLRANLSVSVTEPGGDASIISRSVRFSPFGVYVGIDLSKKEYLTDTDIRFPIVAVNQKGERMKQRELSYKIYRLDWDWWWEGSTDDLSRYVKSTSVDPVADGTVGVVNGYASVPFRVEYPDCGKYLVIVRDIKGGHATGGVFTVDYPDWRGRSQSSEASGSTELSFTLDKKVYEVGDVANVYLPKCDSGKVLLSVENGSEVIKQYWVTAKSCEETCFKLPVDSKMSPNFYVSATLLRPVRHTVDGVPVRLFGVVGASVIDRSTILHPEIEMPDELHPNRQFTVTVRERDNKPMTYTLAVVDEGLLDITDFKTPRPWNAMNQKTALGVKTWDMYDDVIGAFGSTFRSILSIGGDEALRRSVGKEKRFNPVVKFIGPVTLTGGSKSHKLTLPNYVGSVRVMLVAAHNGCYGNVDKTVKVTSPLMLLPTLPRMLSCGDEAYMPVNVFAPDRNVKAATVRIDVDGPIEISGRKLENIEFGGDEERLVCFKIRCDKKMEGTGRIIVTAHGGSHRASDTIFVNVRNPMPVVVNTVDRTLSAGETATFNWATSNLIAMNMEVRSMPSLNFAGSMEFFNNYRHLCTEQLSSKALFILYGRNFLTPENKELCEKQLPGIIKQITSRSRRDGGFSYWPGAAMPDERVSSIAGMVIAEAERQGFRIEKSLIDSWADFQERKARDYRHSVTTDVEQAIRLYSLAKAGRPVKSAMNRLRETKKLSQTATYCLASVYAISGRPDVASQLVDRAERTPYIRGRGRFASSILDDAIALEAYSLCKAIPKAIPLARKISKKCSGDSYVTQDLAFATIAMKSLDEIVAGSHEPVVEVKEKKPGSITVVNAGKGSVELSVMTSYRHDVDIQGKPVNDGMKINVTYTDINGRPITVTNLKQDTEFYARVTVINTGDDVDAMAMTYVIPSGWEIWNQRLLGIAEKKVDYCDIRDDRISFYNSLKKGGKITFNIRLRAAYSGRYLMPSTIAEDMYNPACRATTANSWSTVKK